MQKGGYYQYQCFMRAIQLLQDLIHDGVGQVGDHGQLHLPGEEQRRGSVCWAELNEAEAEPVPSYSRALLMSSAALSMRALRMLARGMDTCSEMDEKGGLSLSAAEQDIGHNSRHRDTIESTTTCVREARASHRACLHSAAESQRKQDHRDPTQTHLQLFISRLGQFSGQSVQSLLDGSVHRQHVGQLAQRGVQLARTEKQGRNEQFTYANRAAATRKVSGIRDLEADLRLWSLGLL